MNRKLDFMVCAAAFCSSVYAIVMYCVFYGPKTFSFFTTISNVFVPIVMAWRAAEGLAKKDEFPSGAYLVAKFVTAIAVTVTFLVYLVVLAPTNKNGFFGAYKTFHCASLCAHVISPLLTVSHFFVFDQKTVQKSLLVICALAYPVFYCLLAFGLGPVFGLRWGDGKIRVPYNFLNYEAPCGWFGFELGHMDSTTIGVGVAYVILVLVLLFLGVGFFLWRTKTSAIKR